MTYLDQTNILLLGVAKHELKILTENFQYFDNVV